MRIHSINNAITYKGNTDSAQANTGKKENFSKTAAAGALIGAIAPVLAISKATKGKFSFDIFENNSLKKDLATILTVSTSAILGGLLGGLVEAKTPEDKKAKVKETLFDITTVAIPALIATGVLGVAKKMNIKSIVPKIIAPIAGIGLGMPLAQKASGVIDKFLHKDDPNAKVKERKLKPQDYIVHIDDLLALMIISKVPFAGKIHADKILPLIYAWCGFESGSKVASKKENS